MTTTDDTYELTVLFPCLNENETIGAVIGEARTAMEQAGLRGEILVADNGSTDGSQETALRAGARVVSVPIRGYGAALYAGSAAAKGKYILMADCDGSYDLSQVGLFVEKLREGYDLVVGNRFRGGIRPGAMPWKNRYLGNPILSGIGRLLFGVPVKDFHCGIRAFSKKAFESMDLQTTGMEYASEMVIKSQLKGLRLTEVPTVLRPDGRSRPPHLRPWRDGWRHLRFMLLCCPLWLFVYPGIATASLGVVITSRLLWAPVEIDGLIFDVHTLFYSSILLMIGLQAILFGAFLNVFAYVEGLVPAGSRYARVFHYVNLETGLMIGALFLFAGAALGTVALNEWRAVGFAGLDPRTILRMVIPSGVALFLGFELILASLLFSALGIQRHRINPPVR